MKRLLETILLVLAIALTAVSCSRGVSRIEIASLPTPNPTSYSFPFPLATVREMAWQVFSIDHQINQPVFGRLTNLNFESTFFAECATNAVFGKEIFLDPANAQDIYLHTLDMPFVQSSVYRGRIGGLPFIAAFHLHLTANGTNTIVKIETHDARVINGTKFGFGSCGPGQANVYVSVQPTTVEEYSLIRYLGGYLGVTNMPALILPKS